MLFGLIPIRCRKVFFSPYMGIIQRLWNGNTFICESAFGRLFEVTSEGEIVWEYVIPDFAEYPSPLNDFIVGEENSCFKAHRYEENLIKLPKKNYLSNKVINGLL